MAIVQLQLGNYSNFIGTHFWNYQVTPRHDVRHSDAYSKWIPSSETCCTVCPLPPSPFLFSPQNCSKPAEDIDEIDDQVFFSRHYSGKHLSNRPRVIRVDLKGGLGPCSSQCEDDFRESRSCSQWDGETEVYDYQENLGPPEGMRFNECDCSWTDFMQHDLNPQQSLSLIPDFHHQGLVEPFDVYPLGASCWDKEERRDTVENMIRMHAEECDYLQGFQAVLDSDNGFSGFASGLLQYLNEEYTNKSIFAFPALPVHHTMNETNRERQLINLGLLVESLCDDSSMFCPLSMARSWTSANSKHFNQYVHNKACSTYHSSALLALAMEAVTLPLRKRVEPVDMHDIASNLVNCGRKAVGVSCALRFFSNEVLAAEFLTATCHEALSLTPGISQYENCWKQHLVWRGFPKLLDRHAIDHWSSSRWSCTTTNTVVQSPHSALTAFPKMFYPQSVKNARPDLTASLSVFGALHSSPSVGVSLHQLLIDILKIDVKRLQRFTSIGMDEDQLLENRSRLLDFVECYQTV